MKKPDPHTKTSAAVGGVSNGCSESWYFAILAFLAIPWKTRANTTAKGTLFKQYHLLRAIDVASAFAKAEHVLSVSENREGAGKLNGRRVDYRKVGVLKLEPLFQKLESGIELFDESEAGVRFDEISEHVISNERKRKLIEYERRNGKPALLDVFWGNEFEKL